MSTPTYLVTGLHADSMAAATLGLQFDLPQAVVVRHELDVEAGSLRRTISDITGVLEKEVVPLEHACTSCAVREDVIPTLERLGQLGRWQAIVVHLPVTTDALTVCRVLGWDQAAGQTVRVAGVVAALDGSVVLADLLEDDLIAERFPKSASGDQRGVGEVLASMVEYADVVTVFGDGPPAGVVLVRHLARPGVPVSQDWPDLSPDALLGGGARPLGHRGMGERGLRRPQSRRRDGAHLAVGPRLGRAPPPATTARQHRGHRGWTRPLPRLFLAGEPPRPDRSLGGRAANSASASADPGDDPSRSPASLTGTRADDVRAEAVDAFTRSLLTSTEMRARGPHWEMGTDGLESWLGPTTRAA